MQSNPTMAVEAEVTDTQPETESSTLTDGKPGFTPQPQKNSHAKVELTPPEPVEFEIVFDSRYGFYSFASNKPGPMPKPLQGSWTEVKKAEETLEAYKRANGLM